MQLDGVFIDMYGTLTAGDRAAVEETCAHVVRNTGVRLTAAELAITWGNRFFHAMESANGDRFESLLALEARTLRETMADLGVNLAPEAYVARLSAYWRNPPLQPDTRAFLERFHGELCIVSNADRTDIEEALARHDIRVAALVTSEDTRSYKPDRRIFDEALRVTGWRRAHVIHVGDSLHSDVGGALAAGLSSVWINRAHRIHDIGNHQPDWEFEDLNGVTALVDGTVRAAP